MVGGKQYEFIDKLKSLTCVEEIWLYGSRARGDHHDRSDVDLALLCPQATAADLQRINEIIEQADTLLKIDCIQFDRESCDDALYHNILRDKKVIYVKK